MDETNPAAETETDAPLDVERATALLHVPARVRPAMATLWRLDARLGTVLATTTDPAIGALRLAWWRDALARLDRAAAPAEPLLRDVARTLVPPLAGADLALLAEGWGAIVDGDPAMLDRYGAERGGALFRLGARLLGGDGEAAASLGAGWALVDLGWGQRDAAFRAAALAAAGRALAGWDGRSPRALRPLGMLAVLARRDVAAGAEAARVVGGPMRITAMLRHRLLGR